MKTISTNKPTLRNLPTLDALHSCAMRLERKGVRIWQAAQMLMQTLPLTETKELDVKAAIYKAQCDDGAASIYELLRSLGCKIKETRFGADMEIPKDVSEDYFG